MELKHKYQTIINRLIESNEINYAELDVIKQKDYIPIMNKLILNGILYENNNIKIYKKDQLIGVKIDDFLIKIIFDSYDTDNSFVIPFSIDEGEDLLKIIAEDNTDEFDIFFSIFEKLSERQKKVILKKLEDSNSEVYSKLIENYPLIERITGMIDDPIMKACEKMTNPELVAIMLMLTVQDRRKILRNVSEKRKNILVEEMHYLGYFKKSERLKAKHKFIKLVKEFLDEYTYNRNPGISGNNRAT